VGKAYFRNDFGGLLRVFVTYMLNLNLLRTFITVVDRGTLSAAAHKLGLRQPTITLHIQNLEDSIGVKLLTRRGKGVELTREGEIVVRKARELLAFCDDLEEEVFAELYRTKRQIRIGAGPIMTDHLLPHIAARFQQLDPGIDVLMEPAETAAIVKGVLDHTYDVGFVGFPLRSDQLELLEWIEDELVLIVPTDHPFAIRESVQVTELAQQHFIWHKSASGIRMFVQKELSCKGLNLTTEPANHGEVPNTMSLLSSVNAGLGVAVIPRYSAQNAIDMGMVGAVRIEGASMIRKLYIARLKHDRTSVIIDQFIDAAKSYGRPRESLNKSCF
jgi:DNA-binding transcriptional LysR family regulator